MLPHGFEYEGEVYRSLRAVAKKVTGTHWNGYHFFGCAETGTRDGHEEDSTRPPIRCAVYTRKSTEEGLEQEFNSLDAQREAAEAYIASQKREGWICLPDRYDDGGFTGGNMDRPGAQAAPGRHRGRRGRLRGGLQGRPDLAQPPRLRPHHGDLREARRLLRLGHPAVQHDHLHGPADPEHPALLRPVRAGDHLRADARQDRRGAAQGQVVRRDGRSSATTWTRAAAGSWSTRTRRRRSGRSSSCTSSTSRSSPRSRSSTRGAGPTSGGPTRRAATAGGSQFNKHSLYSLLTNVLYTGRITYKDEVHDGEQPAIVDEEVFRRVQAAPETQRRHRRGARPEPVRRDPQGPAPVRALRLRDGPDAHREERHPALPLLRLRERPEARLAHLPVEVDPGRRDREVRRRPGARHRAGPGAPGRDARGDARAQAKARIKELEAEKAGFERDLARHNAELRKLAGVVGDERHRHRPHGRPPGPDPGVRAAEHAEIREELAASGRELVDEKEAVRAMAAFDPVWPELMSFGAGGTVEECYFTSWQNQAISFDDAGALTLRDNVIENVTLSGVQMSGAVDLIMTGNAISQCGKCVFLGQYFINDPEIHYNTFLRDEVAGGYYVRTPSYYPYGPYYIDFTDNYWGTMDSEYVSQWILDGNDYADVGLYVAFSPMWDPLTGIEGGEGPATEPTLSATPNPFNPQATVAYAVAVAGPVSVDVYDVRGRLVRTLCVSPPGRRPSLPHLGRPRRPGDGASQRDVRTEAGGGGRGEVTARLADPVAGAYPAALASKHQSTILSRLSTSAPHTGTQREGAELTGGRPVSDTHGVPGGPGVGEGRLD